MFLRKFIGIIHPRTAVVAHDLAMAAFAWWIAKSLRYALMPDLAPVSYLPMEFPIVLLVQGAVFNWTGLYKGVWRFASLPDLWNIIRATVIGALIIGLAMVMYARLDGVPRVLEVGGGDDHRVHVLALVELVVVARGGHLVADQPSDVRHPLLAPDPPDVGDGDEVEVQLPGVGQERGQQVVPGAVGEPDQAHADAVVGADDPRLRRRRPRKCKARRPGARHLDELPPRGTNRHVPILFS